MADTRIFRITRADGSTELAYRRNLSARLGGGGTWRHGIIVHVDATNPAATAGWSDVTSEFLGEDQ